VELISDSVLHLILRGRWCSIIFLNVHSPCEDKGDDIKGSFCEELGHVFDQFPKYDMTILLGDFNAKAGSENNFKPTIGNESLHEITNDNGVKVVNLPHIKIWLLKVECSLIAKYINTPEGITQPD
jgi:hypothetical protein